ncbi:response regulator [Chamaesiphon minutus]|uniref:Response regulator containing a CheY-like receiver domain and a GGDEF domain n=1 Tax=Chamaesiphon minutus (strain ATCC 27169 / PCC 6605) TaxID=1173020 RepID=K9ULX6_CHAP6|nr:response regulator [Chamaesiphon minutus]AFY95795.1 response regulator containing a CheY-like receiver domain and a GGDEF domain [Chamaesiphon minutus PCC 6605]
MKRPIATNTDQFSFSARELSKQLIQHIRDGKSGYWHYQFDRLADRERSVHWSVGTANGQILYSGIRLWSSQMLLRLLVRYVVQTHNPAVKVQIDRLGRQVAEESLEPAKLISILKESNIITDTQLKQALKIKILNDLDIYLLMGSGSASFVAENIEQRFPINGFNPSILLEEAEQRHLQWTQLREHVPSMKLRPILNQEAMHKANLPQSQQQQIERLVQSDKTLSAIAEQMAKDHLEVAQMFAKLVRLGFVGFQPHQQHTRATVMAIDDSPVMLSQFRNWLSALGYLAIACQDAKIALKTIIKVKPSVIFIDINMPEISGFELVKQIRQHEDLRDIPLVILTGEQKLSNKWRAQWSGCEFLSKPLTSSGIGDFQVQLEEMIPRLIDAVESVPST